MGNLGTSDNLLDPSLLRRLEQFQLMARRRARSGLKGERRSRARGQSVEFADYRNYSSGDDFRYIDWNLYGRLDRLFLKLYEEERELPLTVFLDVSESMNFGQPRKVDLAKQLAAGLGHVALSGFDRASVRCFPDGVIDGSLAQQLASVRGKSSMMNFLRFLAGIKAKGPADFNRSLIEAARPARQGGIAMVVSDFLDPAGYEKGLTTLVARGFEVHAVQILAPEEVNPTKFGDLRLVDSESGAVQEVTFGRFRLEAYQAVVAAYCQKLREFCAGRGIGFSSVRSDVSLDQLLLRQLREMEVFG